MTKRPLIALVLLMGCSDPPTSFPADPPVMDGSPGDGSPVDAGPTDAPPGDASTPMGPPSSIADIAIGSTLKCAALDTAAVRCWGTFSVGYGDGEDVGDDELPASKGDVPVGGPVVQMSAYERHVCAVLATGGVRCWGSETAGNLGYGGGEDIGDDETPADAGDVDVGWPAASVATGAYAGCAVSTEGKLRCWGLGANGRLGQGNTDDVPIPSAVGDVDIGGDVASVGTGGAHACAVLTGGALRCWGFNLYGQLGYGHTSDIGDDEAPAVAGDVNVGGPVSQVVAGVQHTCALLQSGDVRCWGANDRGQLGYGNTSRIGDDEVPASVNPVPLGGKAIALSSGAEHTCALLEAGGMRCWGPNSSLELGYASGTVGDDEVPADMGDVPVGEPVTRIGTSDNVTCALLESGKLRCWGRNDGGTLGYGFESSRVRLSEAGEVVVLYCSPLAPVAAVALGNRHRCATDSAGAVRCWGESDYGQTGYATTERVHLTSADVELGFPAAQLSVSAEASCARSAAGAVRCWGRNTVGQLGYGHDDVVSTTNPPAALGDITVGGPAASVATSGWHTCVLLDGGEVRCWGLNDFGQLGLGHTDTIGDGGSTPELPTSVGPVSVGGTVTAIAVGFRHVCALLDTDKLRCWGRQNAGVLGYGILTSAIGDDELPDSVGDVPVGGTGSVIKVVAGVSHTCALMSDGAVRCWGVGAQGQHGLAATAIIGDDEPASAAGNLDLGGAAVQLSAGNHHTCAVLAGGALRCWGRGTEGQLGYGTFAHVGDNETPASAGDVPVGSPVVEVFAGGNGTCVVLDDGPLRCWGEGLGATRAPGAYDMPVFCE